jgi:molybdenum cofactor biosynthesis protein B
MDPSHIQDVPILAAIITVSTTRGVDDDISGRLIREMLAEANIPVQYYSVVTDRIPAIQESVREALKEANCIVVSGGTGLTHDDCTIEAIDPVLEKKMDGFGELFRFKSYEEIGTRSLLSRAVGGVVEGSAIFCIPGSSGAVRLAVRELIIPEIRHILTHARR